jgi:hypothetical protein
MPCPISDKNLSDWRPSVQYRINLIMKQLNPISDNPLSDIENFWTQHRCTVHTSSVADPDPGSGAFIPDLTKFVNSLYTTIGRIRDPVLFYPPDPGSGSRIRALDPGWSNGRIRIRDKTSRIRNTAHKHKQKERSGNISGHTTSIWKFSSEMQQTWHIYYPWQQLLDDFL